MKLLKENFPVEISGADSGTSDFKIAFNAKAFRVLSDTLYQDKVGSIVRETATNALDSHVMAGKADTPIEIHLPDSFEPWFSVKDFGVGLSKEAVFEIYTTYFMSTKDQSNDCTGMLGLGSKVSFAYTDQFTVTSVFNGVKYLYSAFINGAGIPNITLMHSEETTEGNGVEINLSVKSEDFRAFRNAVAHQLRFFKVKPIVKNVQDFAFQRIYEENSSKIEGEGYLIVPSQQIYRADLVVIQGQIGYPIDSGKIASKLTPDAAKLLNRRIFLMVEMPIGTIGVTASREGIEYDDRTVKNISDRLFEIQQDVQKNIEKNLTSIKRPWDRLKAMNSLYSHFVSAMNINLPNVSDRYCKFGIDTGNSKYFWYYRGNAGRGQFTTTRIEPEDDIAIMFIDSSKVKPFALNQVQSQGFKKVYYCFVEKNTDIAKLKKSMQNYFLGFDKFFVQSDFKEPRKPRVASPRTSYLISDNSWDTADWSKCTEKELPEKFIYVEVERKHTSDQDRVALRDFYNLKKVEMLAEDFEELEEYEVIGLPKSSMKKIEGLDCKKMKDVVSELKSKVDLSKVRKLLINASLKNASGQIVSNFGSEIRQVVLESSTELGKIYALAQKAYNRQVSNDGLILANVFNKQIKSKFQDKVVNKFVLEKAKHPIFKLSDWDLRRFTKDELSKFIQIKV